MKNDSPDLKKSIDDAKNKLELKKLELEALRKRYQLAIDTTGSQTSKESRLIEIEIDLMKQEVTLATQNEGYLRIFLCKFSLLLFAR